jgi:hypothetical protein
MSNPPFPFKPQPHRSHKALLDSDFADSPIIQSQHHDNSKKPALSKLLTSHLIRLVSPLTSLRSYALEPSSCSSSSSSWRTKSIVLASDPFAYAVATGFTAFVCCLCGFEAGALGRGHFGSVGVLLVAWWVGGDAGGSAVDWTHGQGYGAV